MVCVLPSPNVHCHWLILAALGVDASVNVTASPVHLILLNVNEATGNAFTVMVPLKLTLLHTLTLVIV